MPSGVYRRSKATKERLRQQMQENRRLKREAAEESGTDEPVTTPKRKGSKLSPELDAVIQSLPGDEKVELYREASDDSGKWAFLSSVQASVFSTDWVQKNCGGGNYMVLVRKPGSHELLARRFLEIDPSIARRAPFQTGTPSQDLPGFGDSMNGLPPLFLMMQQQQQQMMQMQQAAADRQMEMMQANSQQITSILAAMISRPNELAGIVGAVAQLAPKAQDPVELATRLAELTKRGGNHSESLTDKLEEFQLLKRIMNPTEDDTGGWAPLIRDFLPQTLGVLQEALKASAARRDVPVVAPPTAGALPPGASSPASEPDKLMLILQPPLSGQLRSLVPQLVKRGLQGGDAEAFAAIIVEDIPIGLYPQIHRALAEDGIVDAIIGAVPELTPVEQYARDFLAVILEMTGEPDEETIEAAPAPVPVRQKKGAVIK